MRIDQRSFPSNIALTEINNKTLPLLCGRDTGLAIHTEQKVHLEPINKQASGHQQTKEPCAGRSTLYKPNTPARAANSEMRQDQTGRGLD